jgi:toxin ParE1/3/4
MKPVFRRFVADQDVEEAIDYYLAEAGADVALKFVEALQVAYGRVGRQPASGSPRHAHALGVPGLRTWSLKGYPYRVFYFEHADYVEVWRVLHERRDIPRHLQQPDE